MKISGIVVSDSRLMNIGLLILRVGIGLMFIHHGLPKLLAGEEKWAFLGQQMEHIGIGFGFIFWGFMAALAEALGGLLLIAGLLTRPAAMLMFFTMFIAALMHLNAGDGIKGASHAIEMGVVFIFLILAGGGKWSLDELLVRSKSSKRQQPSV